MFDTLHRLLQLFFPFATCFAFLLSCWPALCAPKLDGVQPPARRLDPMIQKIVGEISEERVSAILLKLESFETRNTLSDPTQTNRGIGIARQWIFDQFQNYSPRLEVTFDTHQIPKGG